VFEGINENATFRKKASTIRFPTVDCMIIYTDNNDTNIRIEHVVFVLRFGRRDGERGTCLTRYDNSSL